MKTLQFLHTPMAALFVGAVLAGTLHAQNATNQPVTGTFLGDGKDGKIQFLIVQTREPFSDQAAIQLVFTEKDPAKSKKPGFDAGFKKFGNALILSVFRDGQIFGCEVAHTAHPKSPFSAIGEIKMENFKVTDTTVSGHVTTGGERDAFGQKWNVDLTFSAPLPKGAFAESEAKPTKKPNVKSEDKEEPQEVEKTPAPSGPKLAVAKLPLPTSAVDVEYKEIVGHINFRSNATVSEVAGEFSKSLKTQGWKEGRGNLLGKTNAILKYDRDGANLTIMVQPAGTGSTVKVFTEGLDWTDTPKSATAKPATPEGAEDIEAEAQRRIKEALKGLPGGF
ncbi:MAG: hypothetical protein H8M99_05050 [Gloeobacteraceae cyanobacterium ES-bin-144]|nr:hypothetical protein [Verrucomicrobiales bacterium]